MLWLTGCGIWQKRKLMVFGWCQGKQENVDITFYFILLLVSQVYFKRRLVVWKTSMRITCWKCSGLSRLTHYGCHSSGKLFWDKTLRAGEKICKDKKRKHNNQGGKTCKTIEGVMEWFSSLMAYKRQFLVPDFLGVQIVKPSPRKNKVIFSNPNCKTVLLLCVT